MADRQRAGREIAAGECFPCQRRRLLAALEYLRLADGMRLTQRLGRPVTLARRNALEHASRVLTDEGMRDVRPAWGRRGRRETWH